MPDATIIAVCEAITAIANAYTEALKGQPVAERIKLFQWYVKDLEAIRKLLGLPV